MKQFIESVAKAAVKLSLAVALLLGLTLGAQAQPRIVKHVPQSFLFGQNVVVTNNFTVSYNSTNVWMVVPFGTYYTNVQASVTNAINTNTFNPGWNTPVDCYPDFNGKVSDCLSISISVNSTNVVLSPRQLATTNLLANIIIPNASSTNTLTFTFDRSVDGVNYGTTAADQFAVVFAGPGVTPATICTNLPSTFLAGTKKIRLKSIGAPTASSSAGIVVNNVSLGGFPP